MLLNQDFKEFIALLNNNDVRYLVVGGYAVALHGHPRYTKDIDIWIELTPENADRIVHALKQFGFASVGLTPADFLETVPGHSTGISSPADRPSHFPQGR